MSKLLSLSTVLLLTFMLVVRPVQAHAIELSPEAFAEPVPTFIGDDEVVITEDVLGDLYVGGGTVIVKAAVYGDLLVAGGTVRVAAPVEQDIRVAGGTIQIEDHVGGSVTALGGTVQFTENSTVDGSIVVGGGEVDVLGSVGGHLFVGGGEVRIDGTVLGQVKGGAGNLWLGSDARVGGDVSVAVSEDFTVDENAVIEGRRDIRIVEDRDISQNEDKGREWGGRGSRIFFGMLSTLLGGALLIKLFPKPMVAVSKTILTSPWSTLGWGLVMLFITPIVIVMIMLTMIGLPLGFLLMLLYIAAHIISHWIVSFAVGHKLAETSKLKQLKNPYAQLGAGVLVLAFLKLLPFVGWIVSCVSMLFGLGSLWQYRKVVWAPKKD